MKNSNRDNKSGKSRGESKFRKMDSGKQNFGYRSSGGNIIMHKATCSECGQKCELPFKPTGDKPVFCSNCFGSKSNFNRYSRGDSAKSKFQEKRMHLAICADCGTECEVPFRPTPGKPIYCKHCFRKGDSSGGKKTEQFREQFERVNAKLDAILKLLTANVSTEVSKEQNVMRATEVLEPQKMIEQQPERKVSSKKPVRKKAAVKKTVTKKAMKNTGVSKTKKGTKQQTKSTVSPKKTVAKKATRKKKK